MADIDLVANLPGDSSTLFEVLAAYSVSAPLSGDSVLSSETSIGYGLTTVFNGDSVFTSSIEYGFTEIFSGDSVLTSETTLKYSPTMGFDADSVLTSETTIKYSPTIALPGDSNIIAGISVSTGYPAPVRYQPPCRLAPAGKMILEQVDLFLGDGVTPAQGVLPTDLLLKVFVGNTQADWPMVSGVGISDVQVTAGKVYWTEFTTGYYSIRFFPNMVGIWRVLITYPANNQAISLSYDVAPQYAPPPSGLQASFIRRR